jgi:hypothetical protein
MTSWAIESRCENLEVTLRILQLRFASAHNDGKGAQALWRSNNGN